MEFSCQVNSSDVENVSNAQRKLLTRLKSIPSLQSCAGKAVEKHLPETEIKKLPNLLSEQVMDKHFTRVYDSTLSDDFGLYECLPTLLRRHLGKYPQQLARKHFLSNLSF